MRGLSRRNITVQIEHAGTYWLRVDGWDSHHQWIDFGDGYGYWDGEDIYSGVYSFTVLPICHRVVAHRGYYTKRLAAP